MIPSSQSVDFPGRTSAGCGPQLGVRGALGAQRIDTIASAEHRHFLSGGVKASGSVEQVVRLTTTTATDRQTLDALAVNPAGIAVAPAFHATHGYEPRSITFGYSGHGPRDNGRTPPSIYTHRDNPLPGLAMEQAVRIFSDGHHDGSLVRWSQLGLEGRWAGRRIHAYLPDDGLGFVGGFQARFFDGLPVAARAENVGSREDAVLAVADDPFGICVVGWCAARELTDQVRELPLAAADGEPYRTASKEDVAAGAYPPSYPLNLYLWEDPAGIDPLAYEYCRLALSRQGQEAVARQTPTEEGYVPLSAAHLALQRAKLESWAGEVA
nr:hypothetical protein OH820_33400 [Streptomyces sp. NBC_00857]